MAIPNRYTITWVKPYINLLQVHDNWTWDDAYTWINEQNQMTAQRDRANDPIYHIIYIESHVRQMAEGGYALKNLRRLIAEDPSEEEILFFVGHLPLLQNLINIVSEVYRIFTKQQVYKFTRTLDEAYALIEEHRDKQLKLKEAASQSET